VEYLTLGLVSIGAILNNPNFWFEEAETNVSDFYQKPRVIASLYLDGLINEDWWKTATCRAFNWITDTQAN